MTARDATRTDRNWVLLSLLAVLLLDQIFKIGLGIAPGLSFKNLYLYVVVLYLASRAILQGEFVSGRFPPIVIVWSAFVLYGILSWSFSTVILPYYNPLEHMIVLKSQLVDQLLFLAVFYFGVRSIAEGLWLTKGFSIVLSAVFLLLLIDYFNVPNLNIFEDRADGRMSGAVGNANEFAAFTMFFIVAMTPMFAFRDRSRIILAGAFAGLMLMLLTGSRGAIVGLVLGAVVGTFLLRRHVDAGSVVKVGGGFLLLLTIVVVIVLSLFPEVIMERLDRSEAGTLAYASSGRTAMWTLALQRMIANPITFVIGWGWDTFRYTGIYNDPHSQYVWVLFTLGGIGLALFLAALYSLLRHVISAISAADPVVRRHLIAFVYAFSAFCVTLIFGVMYLTWHFVLAYSGIVAKLAWLAANERVSAGEAARPTPEAPGDYTYRERPVG